MSQPLHIVFCSDDGYAPHLGVALASAIASSRPATHAAVWILDGGISPRNRKRLLRVAETAGGRVRLQFIRPDEGRLPLLPLRRRYRMPVYYRYWMHLFLPADVERAVYLDCDLVVRRDLTELFETDLDGRPVAAAPDKYRHLAWRWIPGWDPAARDYFNTGVLLMDLPAWGTSGFADAMLEIIARDTGEFLVPDQDSFNLACRGRIRELPFAWNYQIVDAPDNDPPIEPWIVHYLGDIKPWNIWNGHPLRRHYRNARRATPWRFWPWEFHYARKGLLMLGGLWLPERIKRPLRPLLGLPQPRPNSSEETLKTDDAAEA